LPNLKALESVAPTWFIELFGGPRAVCEGKSIEKFRTDRCGLLLAILAARPERMYPREELGYLLWPDLDDRPLQLQRLRDELSKLGASLGKDIFEKSGNRGVKVRSGITSDVARFDQLFLTAARATPEQRLPALEAAAALYKDDLLPRYYDDWSERERERLKVSTAMC
jgi:DNA-binding SARP family transcriptional activator